MKHLSEMAGNEWTPAHGRKLRAIRERRGISQFKLAKLADVDSAVVSKYENAHRQPRAVILYKICQALNVDMGDLIAAGLNCGTELLERTPKAGRRAERRERAH